MNRSMEDIIAMKCRKSTRGLTMYQWLFKELEENYFKGNYGRLRNKVVALMFNKEAQAYMIHQLSHYNEAARIDLGKQLKLMDLEIDDEHYEHIEKKMNKYI